MAEFFDLTARINAVGPTGIKKVSQRIKTALERVSVLDLRVTSRSLSGVKKLNLELHKTSNILTNIRSTAAATASSLSSVQSATRKSTKASSQNNQQLRQTSANMADVSQQTAKVKNEIEEFGRVSGLAIRRFAGFTIASGIFLGFANSVREGVKEAIDFEREMARVAQVQKTVMANTNALRKEIGNLSVEFGTSSLELVEVSKVLSQAGLSARETSSALEAIAKSTLAPTFEDINNTVEGVIASMNQFRLQSEDIEDVLGSVNAVAGQFAVEADNIVAAIRRSGGVFASASQIENLNPKERLDALREFIALFTSVRATTRESSESIATGLRTIFTRIQRRSSIEALQELGVELQDVEGKFVGPFEAIKRISTELEDLPRADIRFNDIVEELGGFRQVGKLIPLLGQFSTKAEEALKIARRGGDSLNEDIGTALETLSVQIERTRQRFVRLVREFTQTGTFKTVTNVLLDVADAAIAISRSLEPAIPLLTAVGAVKLTSITGQFGRGFLSKGGLRSNNAGGRTTVTQISSGVSSGNKELVTTNNRLVAAINANTSATKTNTVAETRSSFKGGLPTAMKQPRVVTHGLIPQRQGLFRGNTLAPIPMSLQSVSKATRTRSFGRGLSVRARALRSKLGLQRFSGAGTGAALLGAPLAGNIVGSQFGDPAGQAVSSGLTSGVIGGLLTGSGTAGAGVGVVTAANAFISELQEQRDKAANLKFDEFIKESTKELDKFSRKLEEFGTGAGLDTAVFNRINSLSQSAINAQSQAVSGKGANVFTTGIFQGFGGKGLGSAGPGAIAARRQGLLFRIVNAIGQGSDVLSTSADSITGVDTEARRRRAGVSSPSKALRDLFGFKSVEKSVEEAAGEFLTNPKIQQAVQQAQQQFNLRLRNTQNIDRFRQNTLVNTSSANRGLLRTLGLGQLDSEELADIIQETKGNTEEFNRIIESFGKNFIRGTFGEERTRREQESKVVAAEKELRRAASATEQFSDSLRKVGDAAKSATEAGKEFENQISAIQAEQQGQIGKVGFNNPFKNISTANTSQVSNALQRVLGTRGVSEGANRQLRSIVADTVRVEQNLPGLLQEISRRSQISQEFNAEEAFKDAIKRSGLNKNIENALITGAGSVFGNRKGESFSDILASNPNLVEEFGGEQIKQIREASSQLVESQQQIFNSLLKNLQKFNNAIKASRQEQNKLNDIEANRRRFFANVNNRRQSIQELRVPLNQRLNRLVGGVNNFGDISRITQRVRSLREERRGIIAGASDRSDIDNLAKELSRNSMQLSNNREALKLLANSTDGLSTIQDELKDIQRKRFSQRDFLKNFLIANPAERNQQINQIIKGAALAAGEDIPRGQLGEAFKGFEVIKELFLTQQQGREKERQILIEQFTKELDRAGVGRKARDKFAEAFKEGFLKQTKEEKGLLADANKIFDIQKKAQEAIASLSEESIPNLIKSIDNLADKRINKLSDAINRLNPNNANQNGQNLAINDDALRQLSESNNMAARAATKLSNATQQLANANIPESITLNVSPINVNVNVNGSEAIAKAKEAFGDLAEKKIVSAINQTVNTLTGETNV